MKATLAKSGAGKVVCRLCKGDHFTAKCPYKDTLAGLDGTGRRLSHAGALVDASNIMPRSLRNTPDGQR